ncbi:MAG: ABC transporter substrate-binding protein [Myxococcota bacterium]
MSLSPQVTETIGALDALPRLVGVSDYCGQPPEACARPRVGHGLRPDLEAIARLKPTAILLESTQQGPGVDLTKLAPTVNLPWLTLDQAIESIRRIGALVGRNEAANELARQYESELAPAAADHGPEVLLVIGYPEPSGTFWFMKPTSLHGRLVPAAGARHPKALENWTGPPKMSAEDLVRLDPQWLIVLAEHDDAAALGAFDRLTTLRAVQQKQVRRIIRPSVFNTGPSLLKLGPALKKMLATGPENDRIGGR